MRGHSPCCSGCGALVISDGPFRNGTGPRLSTGWRRLCDRCLSDDVSWRIEAREEAGLPL